MQTIESEIYQGQFGAFTITDRDRQGVIIYRSALMVAAIGFVAATVAVLLPATLDPIGLNLVTWLYLIFSIALGIALSTIHIYLEVLHRALQVFWAIGCISAIVVSFQSHEPLAAVVYHQPIVLLGMGFTFVALTGIFFKEAFCFNRLETKMLTAIVPLLLLGHLVNALPSIVEASLLATWAGLFLIFAIRKAIQPIPPDIGDKSVFDYLEIQKSNKSLSGDN
jgi:uncharacterized integral membrane protein